MGGDVLSQNEIDDLVKGFSTGDIKAEQIHALENKKKRIQTYDFKRALRFSKDQIRSLTRIHENFARLLGTTLSSKLRTYGQVSVDDIDQIPYQEFIGSISKKTILVLYEVPPLEGRILLEISPTVAFAIMDRLLGGYGENYEAEIRDSLTDIEERILSQVFDIIGLNLKESWEYITTIEPFVSEIEVNTQFVQLTTPNETVVVVPLNVTIGETQGMMNLCIPYMALEPILPNLNMQNQLQVSQKEPDEESLNSLRRNIQESKLTLTTLLGETNIALQDFAELKVNDLIRLEQKANSPLIIKVGEEQKFFGYAGKNRNRLAVKIHDTLKAGDD